MARPALDRQMRTAIESFRARIVEAIGDRWGPPVRLDRDDAEAITTRWRLEPHLWCELTIRPFLAQVRVGVVTDDAWRDRDYEQFIIDEDYTPSEFVASGFGEEGLTWEDPPVEHYRDGEDLFRFVTPLEIGQLARLAEADCVDQARRMLLGYARAFTPDTSS